MREAILITAMATAPNVHIKNALNYINFHVVSFYFTSGKNTSIVESSFQVLMSL